MQVAAGHADFSGRWSERRDAEITEEEEEEEAEEEEEEAPEKNQSAPEEQAEGRATMSRRKQSKPRQIKRKHDW